ncbi:MAG TPA: hypothetical protein VHM70_18510 [Polyangiaceae bacterium]|jgi:hypothetical protein|nr:hypothetical protein [Polyangiaceae bacterium]
MAQTSAESANAAPDETEDAAPENPAPEKAAAEEQPPKLLLEPASSGRATCRACAQKIAKGELRLGERLPNPYTETDTSYWFHLPCAAYRRSKSLLTVIEQQLGSAELQADPLSPALRRVAELGREHYRLDRITKTELAPTGRARCRHCREAIASGSLRFALTIFQEGRFNPMGFVHATCAEAYFGTKDLLEHALHAAADLPEEERQKLGTTFT